MVENSPSRIPESPARLSQIQPELDDEQVPQNQTLENSTDNDDYGERERRIGLNFDDRDSTNLSGYVGCYVTICLITTGILVTLLVLILINNVDGLKTDLYLAEHA